MNSLLFFITILIMMFSTIETQQLTELKYGSGPIRSITKLRNGIILGGRCSDHEIEIWVSPNQGLTWLRIGSVANKKDVEFGDLMFLTIPNTSVVYCAFRERNLAGQYSVVVYRSDNDGKDWVYDSTVISGQSQFVGAPWLFLAQNGDLQCYYDSEPLSTRYGVKGGQWIAMQGRKGRSGDWNHYGVIAASRDKNIYKFIRDGMPSVIDLGYNRIMVVTEGIEESQSGGVYANVVRAIQSFDGGKTWDYNGRRIVYQSIIDQVSKRRYNAYCPMGIRIGNGPVGVVFCTDEDFGGIPDKSDEDVTKRRAHIKFIQTLDNFETWGNKKTFWGKGSQAYAPGMLEYKTNQVLISIDHFYGNQRFIKYK